MPNVPWRLPRRSVCSLLWLLCVGWGTAATDRASLSSSSSKAASSSSSRWGRQSFLLRQSPPSHPAPRKKTTTAPKRRKDSESSKHRTVRWWSRQPSLCSSVPCSSSTVLTRRSSLLTNDHTHDEAKVGARHESTGTAPRTWIDGLRGGSSTSTSGVGVQLPPTYHDVKALPPSSPAAMDSSTNHQSNDTAMSAASDAEREDEVDGIPAWKRAFPEVLRRKKATFQRLEIFYPPSHPHPLQHQSPQPETTTTLPPPVTIYLLGTAHVSNDSCRDVKILLETIRPEAIFVELCDARIPLLTLPPVNETTIMKNATNATAGPQSRIEEEGLWSRATAVQQAQGTSRLQALSTVMLTSVQEEYAKDLGVELGGEFRAAYQFWQASRHHHQATATAQAATNGGSVANATGGTAHFILGDRPVHITLRRAWESLRFWPKLKVVVGLLWSCLHKPNPEEIKQWLQQVLSEESDILTKSFEELQKHFPSLHRVIIEERDAYLAAKLVQTCRCLAPGSRVVAVVGAGHVPGICQWLQNNNNTHPNATDAVAAPERLLAELVTTRPPSKRRRRLTTPQDEEYEKEFIHACIHQVAVLQDMPDESFQWAGAIQ